jgi:hypothetical protein
MYTTPVGNIIKKHEIQYQIYADDTQLYASFNPKIPGELDNTLQRLKNCLTELKRWMLTNKLKLNDDKTELFLGISPRLRHYLPINITMDMGNSTITVSETIKNLGVHFDSAMTMSHHITTTCRSVNFHLRNIYRIRKFITDDACHHAIRALVLSRLDYANSLFIEINSTDIYRLQHLQNHAARLIHGARKFVDPVPLIKELHWLPVQKRIVFKLALIIYKCMNDCAPHYLSSVLERPHTSRYALRSYNDNTLLRMPRSRTSAGDRAFSHSGPLVWNSLPMDVRSAPSINVFKKKLKTHLFQL